MSTDECFELEADATPAIPTIGDDDRQHWLGQDIAAYLLMAAVRYREIVTNERTVAAAEDLLIVQDTLIVEFAPHPTHDDQLIVRVAGYAEFDVFVRLREEK